MNSPRSPRMAQKANSTLALKIMKPNGAPKRLKTDFADNKCDYHFIWCPCNNNAMSKEIEKKEAEKEKDNFSLF